MRDKTPVGIANVRVHIPDYDFATTDDEGYFSLVPPAGTEQVIILLEQSPYRLISPYNGIVSLPPGDEVRLTVCGAENRRLQERVAGLNARVREIEQKHELTQRQLGKLQQQLVDTLLFFDRQLAQNERVIQEYDTQVRTQDRRIRSLEDSIRHLIQRLTVALEQRYLRQRAVFAELSAGLHRYVGKARDLSDELRPDQLQAYFLSGSAQQQLESTVVEYNAARLTLLEGQSDFVREVGHYWSDPELGPAVARTLQQALAQVHDNGIYPLSKTVIDQLKQFHYGGAGRIKAQKIAVQAAERELPRVDAQLDVLAEQVARVLKKLTNDM
jgi:hypothetical protein